MALINGLPSILPVVAEMEKRMSFSAPAMAITATFPATTASVRLVPRAHRARAVVCTLRPLPVTLPRVVVASGVARATATRAMRAPRLRLHPIAQTKVIAPLIVRKDGSLGRTGLVLWPRPYKGNRPTEGQLWPRAHGASVIPSTAIFTEDGFALLAEDGSFLVLE